MAGKTEDERYREYEKYCARVDAKPAPIEQWQRTVRTIQESYYLDALIPGRRFRR